MTGSAQDFHFRTQSPAPQFGLDDYQDADQMVRDLLRFHNIEQEAAGLTLIEQINDGLLGVTIKNPIVSGA